MNFIYILYLILIIKQYNSGIFIQFNALTILTVALIDKFFFKKDFSIEVLIGIILIIIGSTIAGTASIVEGTYINNGISLLGLIVLILFSIFPNTLYFVI
jgi:hypothetical protein